MDLEEPLPMLPFPLITKIVREPLNSFALIIIYHTILLEQALTITFYQMCNLQ